jgi:gliding motility-associated-like protein
LYLKFDGNLNGLTYGSFLGGNGDDAAYVLNPNPTNGEIWIAGATESANFPGNKTGTISSNLAGRIDGFVAVLSASGALLKSTFIGTALNDQVYGLKFDIYGFPYIMGTSQGNFPILNAAFSQPGGKQFIGKLKKDLSGYEYATVFGTNAAEPNISPIAFLVDKCENVYISGWGGSLFDEANTPKFPGSGTVGLSITPDAIQSSTDGKDFYFFVLEKNAARQLYGSYYGQNGGTADHVDGGTSRFDEQGVIYQAICANCGGRVNFPTTPGSWRTANGSNNGCNEALVKIEFNFAGIQSGAKASIKFDGDTSGCVPLVINFRDTVALAQKYEWDFADGTGTLFSNTVNVSHTFNNVGTYRVRLIAIDSTKCFPRDTSFVTVRIREDIAALAAVGNKLPPCASTAYRFTNNSVPFTNKNFTNTSFRWIWGDGSPDVITGTAPIDHTYPGVGTYNVKMVLIDTNFCNAPDTFRITIRIAPNVKAVFTTPATGCVPINAAFTNTSLGGSSFLWNFGDGTTSTASNPTHLYTSPGTYRVTLVAIDSSTCNLIDSSSFVITLSNKPTAAFSFSPNPALENIITTFTNNSIGAVRYRWYYGDGDSLYANRRDTLVRHQYNETKQYTPCLVAINQFNCPDTVCLNLNSIVKPLLDVPNAFTPNADGANDLAMVLGIGISKMTFRIYNRWGQVVFESTDRKIGWNGKFKGKDQPMDVYAYTLDATFFDGKNLKKQGDITLLR